MTAHTQNLTQRIYRWLYLAAASLSQPKGRIS